MASNIWIIYPNGPTPHPILIDPPPTRSKVFLVTSSTTSIKKPLQRRFGNVEMLMQGLGFHPPNNQLQTFLKLKTHATVHDGHIVMNQFRGKAPGNVRLIQVLRAEGFVTMQRRRTCAEAKGDVLDAEAEAFLADVECTAPYDQPQALTTTNMFQANHEDAYDSDVDEGPNAAVAFMANLSSTSATNNPVNEASVCAAGDSSAYQRSTVFGDDVVVVATYRTPLCKSKRGGLKDTYPDDILAPVLNAVIEKTNLNPAEVGDMVIGSVLGAGSQRASECMMATFYAGFPSMISPDERMFGYSSLCDLHTCWTNRRC
ncbi:3-ketoacyl-CoA thiolase 2, peroxisomal [Tanacetum coccineum]